MNLRQIANQKSLSLLLLGLLNLILAGLLLTIAYSVKSEFRVAVGELGDYAFIERFNADEAGAPRYRWSTINSVINFPLAPNTTAPNKVTLELGAALAKDSKAATPPKVTVLANGIEIGQAQTTEGLVKSFEFAIPSDALRFDRLELELVSPTFKAPGDPRTLGVKVQTVTWQTTPALRLPPFEVWGWATAYLIAINLIIVRYRNRTPQANFVGGSSTPDNRARTPFYKEIVYVGIPVLALLPVLALPYLMPRNVNLWYSPLLMWWAAIAAIILAIFVWRDTISGWLWEFPARLEQGKLARNILIAASLIYMAYSFSVIIQMDFVGHADYADNGVAARNILRGNGYSLEYAAQFYKFTTLPRPADTWPPLQPIITVPFFAVFGSSAFAAKLPNWILIIVLTWVVYHYGSRYFNHKTGLGAALLVLFEPTFFEAVAYPINDLGFTLLAFLSLIAVYNAANYRPISGAAISTPDTETSPKVAFSLKAFARQYKLWLIAGVWGGLLILSKPSGAVLLVAAGLWLLWHKFRSKTMYLSWISLLLWGAMVLLVASPYFIRNQIQFGFPVYSTERYDAWLLKWYPPDEHIYDLYYPINKPLPNERDLLIYGFDTIFKTINLQFTKLFNDLVNGQIIAPLGLGLAVIGLIGLRRKRYGLVGLLTLALIIYVLFISIYWHYEKRYFMMWLPWLYLLGMYGLSWLYEQRTENRGQRTEGRGQRTEKSLAGAASGLPLLGNARPVAKSGKLAGWLVAGAFLALVLPNLPALLDPTYVRPTGIVITSDWIKANLAKNAVIMTREPWEVSFHADRQTVMFPNNITSLDQLKQVLRDYGVTHFQFSHTNLDGRSNPDEPFWQQRTALWDLIRKKPVPGFKLIYDQYGFLVYEVS